MIKYFIKLFYYITMKCALLLFGMSLCEYVNPNLQKKVQIDYNNSYDNYQKYIYKYLHDKGYSIDVYFSTNLLNDDERKKIIKKYNPVKYSFVENGENKYISRNKKLISVIELCLNNKVDYDLVLITRFDLLFKKDFEISNIKLDKFNLVSVLESKGFICDNFYLFPFRVLDKFYEIIKKSINKSCHKIRGDIEKIQGKQFINFILNEYKLIENLSFYKIVRNFI